MLGSAGAIVIDHSSASLRKQASDPVTIQIEKRFGFLVGDPSQCARWRKRQRRPNFPSSAGTIADDCGAESCFALTEFRALD
jgi:hypothetical protein